MSRFLEAHLASLAIGSAVALGIYVFYGPSGGRQKRGELRGLVRILWSIIWSMKNISGQSWDDLLISRHLFVVLRSVSWHDGLLKVATFVAKLVE